MLLKKKLGPIFRAIKAVVGAVLQGRGGDSPARRDLDPPKMPFEDRGSGSALKESRSRLDRSAIAVRSGRDRGVPPRIFCAVRSWLTAGWTILIIRCRAPLLRCRSAVRSLSLSINLQRPSDEDLSPDGAFTVRWRSGASCAATCLKVSRSSSSLIPQIQHVSDC